MTVGKTSEVTDGTIEPSRTPGTIFNIQRFSVHDGPGIRTTVFMKGCPLQCRWCANAESINPQPELGIIRGRCNSCGHCITACPEQAISIGGNTIIEFQRHKCTACGNCVAVCSEEALSIYGKKISLDEVFKEVMRDRMFYDGGGGITVSGGEPLMQADFVAALFQQCREAGVNTCLDSCGYGATKNLAKILPFTDSVLYDIKHMNTDTHRRFTGVPNDPIINNARLVAESGTSMLCRVPLIKGVNDTEQNMTETARFVKELRDDISVELLPYHRLGVAKYQTLDRPYLGEDFTTPPPEAIDSIKHIFAKYGVTCTAGE
ncbi:glycyl-radical enzyme activating protein [Chloroflexota bacterium]